MKNKLSIKRKNVKIHPRCKKVYVKNTLTGKVKEYVSAVECSKNEKASYATIVSRCNKNSKIKYDEKFIFSYKQLK